MYPKEINHKIYGGSSYSFTLSFKNTDISDAEIASWIKVNRKTDKVFLKFKVKKINQNSVVLSLTPEDTLMLMGKRVRRFFYYDVRIKLGDSCFYPCYGVLSVERNITSK